MRETILKRTSLIVAGIILIVSVGLGVVRNTLVTPKDVDSGLTGRAARGAVLFREKGCTTCHHTESAKTKIGPGLAGLFDRQRLPASGRPATEDKVRQQLIDPYQDMPSFAERLTPEERSRIITYIGTL